MLSLSARLGSARLGSARLNSARLLYPSYENLPLWYETSELNCRIDARYWRMHCFMRYRYCDRFSGLIGSFWKKWNAGSSWNVRKVKKLMLPSFPEKHCSALKHSNLTRSRVKSCPQFHHSDSYRNQISIFGALGVRSFNSVQPQMKCHSASKFNNHYSTKNYTWR
jgi:hypothetical protein